MAIGYAGPWRHILQVEILNNFTTPFPRTSSPLSADSLIFSLLRFRYRVKTPKAAPTATVGLLTRGWAINRIL